MCFSATASFTAGTVLLAVGGFTMSRSSRPAELPYASIPTLFGIQQLIEGALWLTISEEALHLNAFLTHAYTFFSHIFWPMFVPFAVLLIEPDSARRRLIAPFAAAGIFAGLYLAYFFVTEPTTSLVVKRHILYVSPHFFIGPILVLYVMGTCGSLLISGHPAVRWFGLAVGASLLAAYAFYAFWFISVWCFFAAIISTTVVLHFQRQKELRAASGSAIG